LIASASPATSDTTLSNARQMIDEGRRTFRFDTFGSKAFWGQTLQLHRALAGDKLGRYQRCPLETALDVA
jgi:hypothetical protein